MRNTIDSYNNNLRSELPIFKNLIGISAENLIQLFAVSLAFMFFDCFLIKCWLLPSDGLKTTIQNLEELHGIDRIAFYAFGFPLVFKTICGVLKLCTVYL